MTAFRLANYTCALALAVVPAAAQNAGSLRASVEQLRSQALTMTLRAAPQDMESLRASVEQLRANALELAQSVPAVPSLEGQAQARSAEAQARKAEAEARAVEARARYAEAQAREYELGSNDLDNRQWEKAIEHFNKVPKDSSRADAALYWKAYALNKLGRRDEALASLGELQKTMPQSRWLNDAKALEVEVRQAAGKPVTPEAEQDEDLKLIAINGLMQSDPERAVPLLEKFLQGSTCPNLRKQALFVLAQMGSPQARQVLERIARGQANPDLQRRAIEYLGLFGGKESRQLLADIYTSSNDLDVKKQILRSFMVNGERQRLFDLAQNEKDPELRREAIRQLGVMGARNELWQLYQKETSTDNKEQIIQALFVGGDVDHMLELAKTEKDPTLRRKAIRSLGLMGASRTGEALVGIYASDKDPDDRKEVINALFLENNAKALVDIARAETDPAMKKDLVQKLSRMKS